MKRSDIVYMPLTHKNNADILPAKAQEIAKRAQSSIYQTFNTKRNAGRIDRYFILLRSSRMRRIISILGLVLLITIIAIYIILTRNSFINFANELKEIMMYSSYEQILSSVWYLIDEPNFFASFLSRFTYEAGLELPSKHSAYMYASILTNANEASSANMNWWKIGLPSGSMIGIRTGETRDKIFWYYSDTTSHKLEDLERYTTDSEFIRNESYPYSAGAIAEAKYNATSKYWFEVAMSTNHTTWTNLYFTSVDQPPIFSSVSSVWDEDTMKLAYVISLDLRLEYVQSFLKSMLPTNGSKLAITSSDGFVVAIAGFEDSFEDQYTAGIITKSIDQLSDPVWQCIAQSSGFKMRTNFSIECNINNSNSIYRVIRSTIVFSENTNWTIHAALKADEVVQAGHTIYNSEFVISSVICLIIWILLLFLSYFTKNYLRAEQSKLLLSKSKQHEMQHVRTIGIPQSFVSLRKISLAHADDEFITSELNQAMNDIVSSPESLLFNSRQFIDDFEDVRIRDKMVKIFGIDLDLIQNPENDINHSLLRDYNDSPININNTDFNLHEETTTTTTTTQSGNEPQIRIFHIEREVFFQHRNIRNMDFNQMVEYIKTIGMNLNDNNPLFDRNKFDLFLSNTIPRVAQNSFHLFIDSIDLLDILINWKIQMMICDQDLSISLYITLIAFYITMNDRFQEGLPYVRRYFLTNYSDLLGIVNRILINLLKILLPESEVSNNEMDNNNNNLMNNNNNNFVNNNDLVNNNTEIFDEFNDGNNEEEDVRVSNKQRWKNVSKYVHHLVETSAVSRHIEVMNRCRIFIPSVFHERRLRTIESIDLVRFVFNASTVSSLISTPEIVRKTHIFLLNSDAVMYEMAERFLFCLNKNYVSRLHMTVKHVCGTKFLTRLTEHNNE